MPHLSVKAADYSGAAILRQSFRTRKCGADTPVREKPAPKQIPARACVCISCTYSTQTGLLDLRDGWPTRSVSSARTQLDLQAEIQISMPTHSIAQPTSPTRVETLLERRFGLAACSALSGAVLGSGQRSWRIWPWRDLGCG
jgi:hypothetical protein